MKGLNCFEGCQGRSAKSDDCIGLQVASVSQKSLEEHQVQMHNFDFRDWRLTSAPLFDLYMQPIRKIALHLTLDSAVL